MSPRLQDGTPPRAKVLVVDDEPLIGRLVKRALGAAHDVAVSDDAHAALARIDAGERFDVILCDLSMPLMNGLGLYHELKRRAPEQAARVVFMSGAVDERGGDALPCASIAKPFDVRELAALVAARVAG